MGEQEGEKMTFTQLAIVCIVISTVLVGREKLSAWISNRPDPPTPDRGGVPRKDGIPHMPPQVVLFPEMEFPLGMHYAPEPIVPKRRKPKLPTTPINLLTIGFANEHGIKEEYAFVLHRNTDPNRIIAAAHEWCENPDLSFDEECEDGVMRLVVQRESMLG